MTMIESVSIRHRGAFDFETHYDNLCALQNSCPIVAVKAQLADGILDVNGDRIRATDWVPILNTLRINKTITSVSIHSTYQLSLEEQDRRGSTAAKKKAPAILSKEITYRLCKAFKDCMCVSPVLVTVKLQGLLLRERDLTTFAKGLAKNKTMKNLSFEASPVGDEGLDILCRGMKNSTSITSLDFSSCSIGAKGAETLAKIIKHSAMRRHNDAWQGSLRYRRPDLDRMAGIRRITINNNPMVGDQGAAWLAEALKDDLWLKALDMQQCGIADAGANSLLDVIKLNTTIVVLDIRNNPMIDSEILRNVMEQVMINTSTQDKEVYKWAKSSPVPDDTKQKARKRRTKTLQSSFGKKTTIKVTTGAARRRSRSSGAGMPRAMQPFNAESVKPGPGMPWRTALRAGRYRGFPPDTSRDDISMTSSTASTPRQDRSCYVDTTTNGRRNLSDSEMHLAGSRGVKVELEHLRHRLQEETMARTLAEQRVIELSLENKRLQESLLERQTAAPPSLQDESVLQSIEGSFQQFNAFLDLLRGAGLGELISLVGFDQTKAPFGKPPVQSIPTQVAARRNLTSAFDTTAGAPQDVYPDVSSLQLPDNFDDLYQRCLTDMPPLNGTGESVVYPGGGDGKQDVLSGDESSRHSKRSQHSHREASQKESSHREASQREASHREASQKESSHREAPQKETSQREASQKEALRREASHREASPQEMLSIGSDISEALDIEELTSPPPPGGDVSPKFMPIRLNNSAG